MKAALLLLIPQCCSWLLKRRHGFKAVTYGEPSFLGIFTQQGGYIPQDEKKTRAYRAMHTRIARQSIPLLTTVLPVTKLYLEQGETFRCSQIQTFDVTWRGVHVPLAAWCMPYLHTCVSPFRDCATSCIYKLPISTSCKKGNHFMPRLLRRITSKSLWHGHSVHS